MKWKGESGWSLLVKCGVVLVVFMVNLCDSAGDKEEVIFYEDPRFDGDRLFITLANGCYSMDKDWDDRISSVDTQGHCIIGWDHLDCKGLSVKLAPGVAGAEDLGRLKFDNQISSISVCSSDSSKDKSSGSDDMPSKDIWRVGLQEHNKYRRMHGVPDLRGDADLHQEAQGHADYLARNNKFEASPGTQYGENLATSYKKDKLDAIRDVVKRWYDKIDYFNFRDPESNKQRPKSGQFSSIIWKSTTNLGVGVAYNQENGKWVVVCMYSPPATQSRYRENVPPVIKRMEAEAPQFFRTALSNYYNSRRYGSYV